MDEVNVLEEKNHLRVSTWKAELLELARLDTKSVVNSSGCRVIFGSSRSLNDAAGKDERPDSLSPEFLESLPKDLNGSYGSCRVRCNEQTAVSRSIWYSFKIKQVSTHEVTGNISYGWQQIMCSITHYGNRKSPFILCLDCPETMQTQLKNKLDSTGNICPLSWHFFLIEAIRDLYDSSVWSLRHCVRRAEQGRTYDSNWQHYQPDFVHLHEIARHVIHSNETLEIAVDTVNCIREGCRALGTGCELKSADVEQYAEVHDRFSILEKDFKGIKRRSESLKERLQNEINLAFNLVAQRDSRIMVKMGRDSHSDNKNMRSIAIVGLLYLPGTFVSGLFGMNFFDFDVDGGGSQIWKVSDRLWLYWAITVPLTLLTIAVWAVTFHGEGLRRQLGRLSDKATQGR